MLSIAGGEQVMLKVRIAEMHRNIAKQFGVNHRRRCDRSAGVPIVVSTAQSVRPARPRAERSSSRSARLRGHASAADGRGCTVINPLRHDPDDACIGPNNVQGVLKALEQVGLVHMLAEPNLTAVSGETARFLAGGEFPVPAGRDQQGNVTVEFKQFGVGLSFTPVVLSAGRISLQISTEVSELTNTGAFTLQGGSTTDPRRATSRRRA